MIRPGAEPSERLAPQLVMRRPRLDDLPPVRPPDGFRVRSFEPGDERHWLAIIGESFARPMGPEAFSQRFGDGQFRPERVLFMAGPDGPVATAAAWLVPRWGATVGVLHMVGAVTASRGLGLGHQVSLAAMHQMAAEGRRVAVLQTDDFRLAAIRTYLRLRFQPYLIDDNQRARWRRVLAEVGAAPDDSLREDVLAGPVRRMESAGEAG